MFLSAAKLKSLSEGLDVFNRCFVVLFWFLIQESVKTKHPQLLYESKLYKILQGGSKLSLLGEFVSLGNFYLLLVCDAHST